MDAGSYGYPTTARQAVCEYFINNRNTLHIPLFSGLIIDIFTIFPKNDCKTALRTI